MGYYKTDFMNNFAKPNVVISQCINFKHVRWNGDIVRDNFAQILGKYVNYQPICPEVAIGLGIPREPIRIVQDKDKLKLLQHKTKKDCTKDMHKFSDDFLSKLEDVDGFFLKNKSPSCGVSGVKIYHNLETGNNSGKTKGMFAQKVFDHFPTAAIEDEGRVHDDGLRHHFLIKLFTLAEFRELNKKLKKVSQLTDFHARYKYTFMAYSQNRLKAMGRVLANHHNMSLETVANAYKIHLENIFFRQASHRSHTNVLLHCFGYVSQELSKKEREHFLHLVDQYSQKQIPLLIPLEVLRGYTIRCNTEYLLQQKYFNPYPEELVHFKY